MSTDNRIAGRQNNPNRERYDFYPTDPLWVQVLMDRVRFDGTVTEPCAGDGVMVDVIKRYGYDVEAFDIEPRRRDIRQRDTFEVDSYDNVVTNAPFRGAFDMVRHWLSGASGKVCILTQASFMESQIRGKFYSENPPVRLIYCCKRMKVGGKSSQFPHVWFVWDNKANNKSTEIEWVYDFSKVNLDEDEKL